MTDRVIEFCAKNRFAVIAIFAALSVAGWWSLKRVPLDAIPDLSDTQVNIYWARSRTLEYLSSVLPRLPKEVQTELGPDATGLGWVFQYVLTDESNQHSLAELRSCQDWYLRYHLKSVPGVAEVAPIGGFNKQYQVNVDPNRLLAYGIS